MNRQERRKLERQQREEELIKAKVAAFRKTNLMGEACYQEGYNAGWYDKWQFTLKDCYCAFALALKDYEGYGRKRLARVLRRVEHYIVNELTTEEMIDQVFERFRIRLNFEETFPEDRIEEVGK